jgi:hypothetical protein
MRRRLDRPDESVPSAWDRLNETRVFSRIVKRFAQLSDRGVQPDVEIDKGFGAPQLLPDLLTGNYFTRSIEKQQQNLQRLVGEADFDTSLSKFAGACVQFEYAESKDARGRCGDFHDPCHKSFCLVVLSVR